MILVPLTAIEVVVLSHGRTAQCIAYMRLTFGGDIQNLNEIRNLNLLCIPATGQEIY